jgi:hypothetical protein
LKPGMKIKISPASGWAVGSIIAAGAP